MSIDGYSCRACLVIACELASLVEERNHNEKGSPIPEIQKVKYRGFLQIEDDRNSFISIWMMEFFISLS